MQIVPSAPLPLPVATTHQQQGVANGLHNVQVQAVTPVTQQAIAPTPETNKGEKAKEKRERERRGRAPAQAQTATDSEGEHRGENVNLCV